jgi:hypothetical protein
MRRIFTTNSALGHTQPTLHFATLPENSQMSKRPAFWHLFRFAQEPPGHRVATWFAVIEKFPPIGNVILLDFSAR